MFLNRKYLAYIVMLAGWIWFCFWLYTHGIFPKLNPSKKESFPIRMENLDIPLAFTWRSAIPLCGEGFETWQQELAEIDSTDEIVVLNGYYFKDESSTMEGQLALGRHRIENVLSFLRLNRKRLVIELLPQEINADVKSNPFSATGFEKYSEEEVLSFYGDTAQICFPIPDSLLVPDMSLEKLDAWGERYKAEPGIEVFMIGTADGTGIAESSDIAMDRATWIKERWMINGWDEKSIHISSGQRNNPLALQNRCVLIYFEHDFKE